MRRGGKRFDTVAQFNNCTPSGVCAEVPGGNLRQFVEDRPNQWIKAPAHARAGSALYCTHACVPVLMKSCSAVSFIITCITVLFIYTCIICVFSL